METPPRSLHDGKSIFVQLPYSHEGRRGISCLPLDSSIWEATVGGLKSRVFSGSTLPFEDLTDHFYVINNGRVLEDNCAVEPGREYVLQCRVLGGKGGFGSLLRSFGSQISKNRNQDACRDLSGRRIRNVKAEIRVKEYVEKQAEKEKEKKQKKEEKYQKLKTNLESKPKHNFDDPEYEAERKKIPDKIFSAVEEGIRVMSEKSTVTEGGATVASTSKVSQTFDGSVEKVTETVTATATGTGTATGSVTVTATGTVTVEKKRKHEDPMVKNMDSKRMKGWLGVDDDSDDSGDDVK